MLSYCFVSVSVQDRLVSKDIFSRKKIYCVLFLHFLPCHHQFFQISNFSFTLPLYVLSCINLQLPALISIQCPNEVNNKVHKFAFLVFCFTPSTKAARLNYIDTYAKDRHVESPEMYLKLFIQKMQMHKVNREHVFFKAVVAVTWRQYKCGLILQKRVPTPTRLACIQVATWLHKNHPFLLPPQKRYSSSTNQLKVMAEAQTKNVTGSFQYGLN